MLSISHHLHRKFLTGGALRAISSSTPSIHRVNTASILDEFPRFLDRLFTDDFSQSISDRVERALL